MSQTAQFLASISVFEAASIFTEESLNTTHVLSPLILAGVDRLGRSGQGGREIVIFLWWRFHWDNSPVEMRTIWDWHLGQQVNI